MVEDLFGIVGSSIAGAFHVEAVVAEGGFSVVYRAQHQGFNAPVALKCLKLPEKLSADRQKRFLAQFRAEGELLFALSASISTVVRPLHIDALTTPDGNFVPYMVLEWLDGETLDVMLERRGGALPIKKLVRLLTPVAEALAKAHDFHGNQGSVSIVHCDVKPENIFIARVGDEEVVKILDFGVSKAQSVANQVVGKPQAGQRAPSWFTPAFAAPEQWAPDRLGDVGPWTDVWGLALTLVESLKGSAVMEGEPMEIRALALDPARRPTPKALGIAVDSAVEKVFVRALAVDPRERPRDAGEFWDELTAALGMRDARPRDARREAGSVPREEVIEAARPPPPRLSGKAPPAHLPPGVIRPAGMTRATLGIDDPFGDAEPLDDGLDDAPSPLEAALPSIPPGGLGGEAVLPSLPPEAPGFGREASLPSIPPQDLGQGDSPPEVGFDFTLAEPPPRPASRLAPETPEFPAPRPEPIVREAAPAPSPPALNLQLDAPEPAPAAAPRRGLELERTSSSSPRAQHVLKPRVMASEPEQARRPLPLFPTGIGLVIAAISVGAAGRVYHGQTGQALALGPVSATPIAAVLLVAGLGLIVFHLLPKDN